MLKKTITYKDYNDVERTEDFYFNLSKAEVTEMQLGTTGGLSEQIKKIIAANDNSTIIKIFKDLILNSYGEKSPDGKRFMKSEEIRTAFSETEAYSNFFMELSTNAVSATEFVKGIMPADMIKETNQVISNTQP